MDPQTTSSPAVRRPAVGLGWGAVVGAGSGFIAAWVFVFAIFVAAVAEAGPGDVASDGGAVFLLIYGFVGSLVGGVIGSGVGAVAGFLFGVTRTERTARFIAPAIGLIPFVVGPRMLEEDGWSVLFVVGMVFVAVAYGAIGWTAGRLFARQLADADGSDETELASEKDRAEIDRLVGANKPG